MKNAGITLTRFDMLNAKFRKIQVDQFHIEMKISGPQRVCRYCAAEVEYQE